MTNSQLRNSEPVLSFDGKKYDIKQLAKETQELVKGMQVADAQLRMHEDTLKIIAVGRQSIALQLREKLKEATPISQ